MNCSDVQEVLPKMLGDGQDEEFQAHLSSCAACAQLVADLELIASQSHELAASDEPSPHLWIRIAAQLRSEGLIREPETVRARPVLVAEPRRRRWNAWWLVPVAASLLAAGVYVLNPKPAPTTIAEKAPAAAPAPDTASPVAASSVSPEDEQLLDEVSHSAPMMRATYENELRSVNSDIRAARAYVDQNPGDDDARQHLMEAYEQKQMLYQLALDHVQ